MPNGSQYLDCHGTKGFEQISVCECANANAIFVSCFHFEEKRFYIS